MGEAIGAPTDFQGRMTMYVMICVMVGAFSGFLFGYDIGISGGVTGMDDFLMQFFPTVYERKNRSHEDNYCKYNDPFLQMFTSAMYLAALVASFVAAKVCSKFGRKPTMQMASFFYIFGIALQSGGKGLAMVVFGRLVLGLGVGFGNQAAPLFLSELAPAQIRGALNICFQLLVTIGILTANIINYFAENIHPHGWRISLGLASIPAMILLLGSFIICETPSSLIERNRLYEGKAVLKSIRGIDNVDREFELLVHASLVARQVTHPFHKLLEPSSRPPLVISIMLQVFQQFTGINAIMFYAPMMFQAVGFNSKAALISTMATGLVNIFSTLVSVYGADRAGRRVLMLEACVQLFVTQTLIGVILSEDLTPTGSLNRKLALVVVILVCMFVMGFAWSLGPLAWLIPSETFPLETRTAGFACAVSSNMLCTFLMGQYFLSMLCYMKAGIFFFFAAWILAMGCFTLFLLPETKGVPIDEMVHRVWAQHWFWKRYMNNIMDDGSTVHLR